MTDKPKPKRRWLQFSLRTMFVVVTVLCLLMGIAVITVKRARDQRQTVEAIWEKGGVFYKHQILGSDPPGPEWLRRLIGNEYFFTVAEVRLSEQEVNDASLAAIERLTEVRKLNIYRSNITNDGLEHLKKLTKLLELSLTNNILITDDGLEHLKGLTNLRRLDLYHTKVTDEGVKKLRLELPNCKIFLYR